METKKIIREVDPKTLKVKEIEVVTQIPDPLPRIRLYVYLILESGCWEGEQVVSTEIYETFKNAYKDYTQRIKDTRTDFKEWCDEDQIEENEDLTPDGEQALFEIYQRGNYDHLHNVIRIIKKEII